MQKSTAMKNLSIFVTALGINPESGM